MLFIIHFREGFSGLGNISCKESHNVEENIEEENIDGLEDCLSSFKFVSFVKVEGNTSSRRGLGIVH